MGKDKAQANKNRLIRNLVVMFLVLAAAAISLVAILLKVAALVAS